MYFSPQGLQASLPLMYFSPQGLQASLPLMYFSPQGLQASLPLMYFSPQGLQASLPLMYFSPQGLQSFFTPYVLQPTRLTSKSLIDNIFFNSLEYQSYSGNTLIQIADHLIQFLILGFIQERSIPKINLFKRDFSDFNDDEFRKEVNQINWDVIVKLDLKYPNLSLNKFYTNLTFLLDELAPYKKVSNKEYRLNFKHWTSTEILNLMKQRDKLLKDFNQENDPTKKTPLHYTAYKQQRNLVTQKNTCKQVTLLYFIL